MLYCTGASRHVIRSSLLCLGSSLITAINWEGKGAPGWRWPIPRYGCLGVDIGAYVWSIWERRCQSANTLPKGVFAEAGSGAPLEYQDVMKGCHTCLEEAVELKGHA